MTDAEVKMVTDCVGRLDRLAVETTVALQAARANMLAMATRLEAAEKELAATQVRKTLDSESADIARSGK